MFYKTFDSYHLSQAWTWPGPEHYLSYQAQAQAGAYLYLNLVPRSVMTDIISVLFHVALLTNWENTVVFFLKAGYYHRKEQEEYKKLIWKTEEFS